MQILCPECGTTYEIVESRELNASRFFVCSTCNHEWEQPDEESENVTIDEIVFRLRGDTDSEQDREWYRSDSDSQSTWEKLQNVSDQNLWGETDADFVEKEPFSSRSDIARWARFLAMTSLVFVIFTAFRQQIVDYLPPAYDLYGLIQASVELPRERFLLSEFEVDTEYSGTELGLRLDYRLSNISIDEQRIPTVQAFLRDEYGQDLTRFRIVPDPTQSELLVRPLAVGEARVFSVFVAPIPSSVAYVGVSYLHPSEAQMWRFRDRIFGFVPTLIAQQSLP